MYCSKCLLDVGAEGFVVDVDGGLEKGFNFGGGPVVRTEGVDEFEHDLSAHVDDAGFFRVGFFFGLGACDDGMTTLRLLFRR
jgi:hypothetical protein